MQSSTRLGHPAPSLLPITEEVASPQPWGNGRAHRRGRQLQHPSAPFPTLLPAQTSLEKAFILQDYHKAQLLICRHLNTSSKVLRNGVARRPSPLGCCWRSRSSSTHWCLDFLLLTVR